jgi:multicomponent Na+:H+ antiporter subunit G
VSAAHWVAGGLMTAGVAVLLVCSIGLVVARSTLDRLHLVAPASSVGGPLICAAVLVNESFSQAGIHAILVGAILLAVGPVLTHVTARAARLRETDGLVVLPSELEAVEQR